MKTFIIGFLFLIIGLFSGGYIQNKQINALTKEVTQLRMLKTHFYDFRNRIYKTIPLDYLSQVTIGDFDFDKYLEE